MNTTKKLYRSETNKVFAGVIGGIGEYFDIDPTILRLVYILITIASGVIPAIIGYIIAILIVPKSPFQHSWEAKTTEKPKESPNPSDGQVKKEEPKKEDVKTEKLDI